MKKIVCVISELLRDEFWLPLSIKSYIDWADAIVIIDGSNKNLLECLLDNIFTRKVLNKVQIINSPYPHNDKGADGKQRQKYLSYIQKHYPGELAIVVDSDEILADDAKEQIDEFIRLFKQHGTLDIINPRMEHFIDDFSHVDATQDYHFCPGRIFRIDGNLYYPESEHPIITHKAKNLNIYQPPNLGTPVLYYHYAYVKGKQDIIEKYRKHSIKSEIHTPEFLKFWKNSHLLGRYPKKTFMGHHPRPIREEFEL